MNLTVFCNCEPVSLKYIHLDPTTDPTNDPTNNPTNDPTNGPTDLELSAPAIGLDKGVCYPHCYLLFIFIFTPKAPPPPPPGSYRVKVLLSPCKSSIVTPLIKNSGADAKTLKNYRLSNLSFLSGCNHMSCLVCPIVCCILLHWYIRLALLSQSL